MFNLLWTYNSERSVIVCEHEVREGIRKAADRTVIMDLISTSNAQLLQP